MENFWVISTWFPNHFEGKKITLILPLPLKSPNHVSWNYLPSSHHICGCRKSERQFLYHPWNCLGWMEEKNKQASTGTFKRVWTRVKFETLFQVTQTVMPMTWVQYESQKNSTLLFDYLQGSFALYNLCNQYRAIMGGAARSDGWGGYDFQTSPQFSASLSLAAWGQGSLEEIAASLQ